jgi:hypothetical protein
VGQNCVIGPHVFIGRDVIIGDRVLIRGSAYINSSNVPDDFKLVRPETGPAVVQRATQLYAEIETAPQPPQVSTAAAEKIEAAFNQQVQYVATLDGEYAKRQEAVQRLKTEREQMRGGYETELQRLDTENTRNAARTERLAKEIERKKSYYPRSSRSTSPLQITGIAFQ